jgi:hypothetical protein
MDVEELDPDGPLGCAFKDENYAATRIFELADEQIKAKETCDEKSTRDVFSNKVSSFEDATETWIRTNPELSESDRRQQLIELTKLSQEMRKCPEQYEWL